MKPTDKANVAALQRAMDAAAVRVQRAFSAAVEEAAALLVDVPGVQRYKQAHKPFRVEFRCTPVVLVRDPQPGPVICLVEVEFEPDGSSCKVATSWATGFPPGMPEDPVIAQA